MKFNNIHSQFLSKAMLAALLCLGLSTLACSQRGKNRDNPDPVEKTGTQLVTLSRGLLSLDGLNVEGASLIAGQTKRDKERMDLAQLSAEYATRYREVVAEAAKLPPTEVEARLRAGFTPEEFETFLPLIRQHLRLAKVDSLPSAAAIAQDFQLLRYKKPFRP